MNETTVTTGKARLSYEHVFKPYAQAGKPADEAKYSVTVLVPKSDIATKQRIDAAIAAAKQQGVNKCWNGAMPAMVAIPVYDGDGVRPNGERFGPECAGCWVFTASSKQQPQVVDVSLNPIINQSDVYSGCYARVCVNFFAYNSNGKRGIGCGLQCLQKLEDGEPLGGRVSIEEAFGTPAAPQTATAYQQPAPAQAYAPQSVPQYQAPAQSYQQPYAPQPVQQAMIDPLTGRPYGT